MDDRKTGVGAAAGVENSDPPFDVFTIDLEGKLLPVGRAGFALEQALFEAVPLENLIAPRQRHETGFQVFAVHGTEKLFHLSERAADPFPVMIEDLDDRVARVGRLVRNFVILKRQRKLMHGFLPIESQ